VGFRLCAQRFSFYCMSPYVSGFVPNGIPDGTPGWKKEAERQRDWTIDCLLLLSPCSLTARKNAYRSCVVGDLK
jgi:hypothetical protein